jgi:hypothetical protein
MIDGKVHDAWLEAWHNITEPLPLPEWLVAMFGTEAEIEVMVEGENVYKGLPQHFTPVGRGLTKI